MAWDQEVAAHREATSAGYRVLQRTPRSDLRWLTVILAAYVVRLGDEVAGLMRDAVASFSSEWRETLMQGGRIRRDPRGYTRWAGVVEIDLIHPAMVCSSMKRELLAELGVDLPGVGKDERIAVLHCHFLVDGRGHTSWAALSRDIRLRWSEGPRQVHVAELHATGTISDNIERLASYSTKFKFVYAKSWLERKTEYLRCEFEADWCEYIKKTYRIIGIDNLLVSSVRSRSKPGSKVYSKTCNSVVENANFGALQLVDLSKTHIECNASYRSIHTSKYSANDGIDTDTIRTPSNREISMRIKDILPYIDLGKMTSETLDALCDAMDRAGEIAIGSARLEAQYGDELSDIEIEQARLGLEQTRAEIERSRAEATKDLADAYNSKS